MKDKPLVAKRIQTLRKNCCLTQQQLGDAVGLSMEAIRMYENGKREPAGRALVKLEQFFGVSGACIFGLEDIPAPLELPPLPEHKPLDIHFVSERHPAVPVQNYSLGYTVTQAQINKAVADVRQMNTTRSIPNPQSPQCQCPFQAGSGEANRGRHSPPPLSDSQHMSGSPSKKQQYSFVSWLRSRFHPAE